MSKFDDVRLISGVWYRLDLSMGKSFTACCIMEESDEGVVTFFEFPDESRKAAADILPHLVDLVPIDPPEEISYRIEDFLDDEDEVDGESDEW
ncbi:hypothetical protein [Sediminispirochaeta bajacaliforniensis]|jgi:hypothetical protein|uniref:hypothetical protein n=1 Tax=Sediminispirochaeta bajacaliforniensis TaxID=148 RepID=UPI0003667183|nr:hypothetical protein [Sediminispirochaeta bajacaliforniensis]